MDSLFIENMIVRGRHGVYEEERKQLQAFEVNIQATVNTEKAGRSDLLEDTVCWTYLEKIVIDVIEGPSMHLIEAIAEKIAQNVLAGEPRIEAVTVTVKKKEIRVSGVPGVSITRRQ